MTNIWNRYVTHHYNSLVVVRGFEWITRSLFFWLLFSYYISASNHILEGILRSTTVEYSLSCSLLIVRQAAALSGIA